MQHKFSTVWGRHFAHYFPFFSQIAPTQWMEFSKMDYFAGGRSAFQHKMRFWAFLSWTIYHIRNRLGEGSDR
jgi:hypothetical protein